jgi:hypothetical protein
MHGPVGGFEELEQSPARFHCRLFNLVPIACERIVENMNNPVVVPDAHNKTVEFFEFHITGSSS